MSTTLATIHVVGYLNTFDTHHTPIPSRLTNGIVQTSTFTDKLVKVVVEESVENGENYKIDNRSPTLFEDTDITFDNCNLSEVITFL